MILKCTTARVYYNGSFTICSDLELWAEQSSLYYTPKEKKYGQATEGSVPRTAHKSDREWYMKCPH